MQTRPASVSATASAAHPASFLAKGRGRKYRPGLLALGYLALVLVIATTVIAFYGLIDFGGGGLDGGLLQDAYFHSILSFSLLQAGLSAGLSVLLAWPLARALYYLPSLPLRPAFLSLCLLCFVLPTLVLITGLVALLGRSGSLSPWLGDDWNLYGLHGILLAHVFLNLPFAVRALYLQLQGIPDSSWQMALQLKLSRWQRWQLIEWPALRGRLLMLAGFVFVLCFNSFAVVLALGGGPQSTTLEVAIYQALKYDFNLAEALTLAWVQFLIAGSLFVLMARFGAVVWLSPDTATRRFIPAPGQAVRWLHALVYALGWLLLLAPLLALLPGLWALDSSRLLNMFNMTLLRPALTTLGLGLFCALLALGLTYLLLLPVRRLRNQGFLHAQWLLEWLSTHTLIAPAMVLSVGWYIFLLTRVDVETWGMGVVALLNTVIVIPFAFQQLRPRLFQFDDQYQKLSTLLKLSHWQRLHIEWPWLRRTLASAFVLVLLLAMGDVAIFSIFGDDDWITLPWLIYNYASTYRMAEASLASLLLLVICAVLVGWFEWNRLGE